MAMQTQGCILSVGSTTFSTQNSSLMYIVATAVGSTAATCDFVAQGFTSDMYVGVSTGSTELPKIKTVAATVLEIHGTFVHATAAAARECVGYTFNQIGEITDFAGPGGAAAVIDITNINSTAKQKLIGIRDEGQVSMTLNYNATDTGQAKMRSYRSQRQSAKYSVIFTDSSVELGVFVHGSICISYSGRCYISSFLASRSANTGECTNSCRWSYALMEEKRQGEYLPVFEDDRGTFLMSSKDICMIEHLPLLTEAGIDSFKIEGRMKGVNYVAGVVKTYREALGSLGGGSA